MKTIITLLLIITHTVTSAQQNSDTVPIIRLPLIKQTTLTTINSKPQFSTTKWKKIEEKNWLNYFAIENNKLWTGQQVTDARVLGYWGLGEASIAYVYVVDVLQNDAKTMPSVFISSYNATTQRKGVDINPFEQAPAPTGMKGKVTITKSITINEFGGCTAKATYKTATKTLSKVQEFSINEDGSVHRP